jgi:hypothetical protein
VKTQKPKRGKTIGKTKSPTILLFFYTMRAFILVLMLAVVGVAMAEQTLMQSCSRDADCGPNRHIVCDERAGQCMCDDHYAGANCSYTRKKQLVAFLLAFLVPCGGCGGYFYLGRTALGIAGAVMMYGGLTIGLIYAIFFLCGGVTCFVCTGGEPSDTGAKIFGSCVSFSVMAVGGLVVAMSLAAGVLHIYAWVAVLMGTLKDGHGHVLYENMTG